MRSVFLKKYKFVWKAFYKLKFCYKICKHWLHGYITFDMNFMVLNDISSANLLIKKQYLRILVIYSITQFNIISK